MTREPTFGAVLDPPSECPYGRQMRADANRK